MMGGFPDAEPFLGGMSSGGSSGVADPTGWETFYEACSPTGSTAKPEVDPAALARAIAREIVQAQIKSGVYHPDLTAPQRNVPCPPVNRKRGRALEPPPLVELLDLPPLPSLPEEMTGHTTPPHTKRHRGRAAAALYERFCPVSLPYTPDAPVVYPGTSESGPESDASETRITVVGERLSFDVAVLE